MTTCGKDIGIYLGEDISGQSNISWNLDVGASGWMVILGWGSFIYVGFSALLLSFGYRLFGAKSGSKGVMIFGAFGYIYFFHGWNSAFFNLIIYAFVYQTLIRVQLKKSSAGGLKNQ